MELPGAKNPAQMLFAEGNQVIEGLPAETPEQPFTDRVRLRRLDRRAEDADAHRGDRRIKPRAVNGIPIMEDEPVGVRPREDFAELLQGPRGGWVARDVYVNQPPASRFHHGQNAEHPELRSHCHAEVAGDQGVGVIPDKGSPALATSPAPSPAGPAESYPMRARDWGVIGV